MESKMEIKPLKLEHLEEYLNHLARHFGEYGVGGIIAQPFPVDEPWDKSELRPKLIERWSKNVGEGSWEMTWGLFDNDSIVGHLELIGHSMPALKHRTKLGMGLEEKYRSQGFGKQLVQTAITWAKEQSSIAWIDLNTFAHNKAAINLYKSFGFIEVGRVPDRIRVKDQKIDDLHMVLKV